MLHVVAIAEVDKAIMKVDSVSMSVELLKPNIILAL